MYPSHSTELELKRFESLEITSEVLEACQTVVPVVLGFLTFKTQNKKGFWPLWTCKDLREFVFSVQLKIVAPNILSLNGEQSYNLTDLPNNYSIMRIFFKDIGINMLFLQFDLGWLVKGVFAFGFGTSALPVDICKLHGIRCQVIRQFALQ